MAKRSVESNTIVIDPNGAPLCRAGLLFSRDEQYVPRICGVRVEEGHRGHYPPPVIVNGRIWAGQLTSVGSPDCAIVGIPRRELRKCALVSAPRTVSAWQGAVPPELNVPTGLYFVTGGGCVAGTDTDGVTLAQVQPGYEFLYLGADGAAAFMRLRGHGELTVEPKPPQDRVERFLRVVAAVK